MRHLRRLVPGLAVLALLGGLSAHPALRAGIALAQAQQVWDVQVGGDPAPGITTTSFWPDIITIHTGDTVRWTFAPSSETHTVLTQPVGAQNPPAFVPGPGPGEFSLGEPWFPIGPSGPDATYDPDSTPLVNSGADFEGADTPPYTLIFTKPGVYQPSCVLHFGMFGRVEVVARDATLTLPETPAQAQARGQQGFRGRATAFNNLIFAPPPTFPASILPVADAQTNVGTASVHNVVAGLGFGGLVTALQFLPADLTVRRGDTVIWSNSDPLDPGHTVTFTSGAPPPDFPAVRGTQPSGQPLFVLTADTMQPTGGSNYTGQGYVNSGFLAPGRAVALTIDAPAGTYAYQCLVHRDVMKGTITVVE